MKTIPAIPKLRWFIAGLLLVVTLINCADRLTVSVRVGEISRDLHLSELDYSQIVAIFLAAYAVMYRARCSARAAPANELPRGIQSAAIRVFSPDSP